MRRSVGTRDFEMVNTVANTSSQDSEGGGATVPTGPCWICKEYEISQDRIIAKFGFEETPFRWRWFEPIEDAPDLFLNFSRLHRERDFAHAALSFSHQYRLPCGATLGAYDAYAPPEQLTLERFFKESQRAWVVVSLYESVLNQDEVAARKLLTDYQQLDDAFARNFKTLDQEPSRGTVSRTPLHNALAASVAAVNRVVETSCGSTLVVGIDGKHQAKPSDVRVLWYFDDLLGAMYLQMYWLLASGGNLVRCEYCKRMVSLARPHPQGRKRRRDKRFCDDACRQAHHRSKKRS